jgi:ubiquinone/menaquinone biosynthesis C-methylase UbiE
MYKRMKEMRHELDLRAPRDVGSLHQAFRERHDSPEVEATFRWLDQVDRNPSVQELKRRMLDLCPVRSGDRVLDVGCGLGHELMRLGRHVGMEGLVVGIDANPSTIAEARRRVAGETVRLALEVGDAQHLEFADDFFDICRTERVLRYLDNPEAALREMARVVRPGGFVAAFDFDSDQTIVDAPDSALARRVATVLDAAVPHPWIGRQLFRLYRRVGLIDVRIVPHAICLSGAAGFAIYRQLNDGTIARAAQAGLITPTEVAAWWTALESAAGTEAFFSANLGFIAIGRKP